MVLPTCWTFLSLGKFVIWLDETRSTSHKQFHYLYHIQHYDMTSYCRSKLREVIDEEINKALVLPNKIPVTLSDTVDKYSVQFIQPTVRE